jgi:hypothetical protein
VCGVLATWLVSTVASSQQHPAAAHINTSCLQHSLHSCPTQEAAAVLCRAELEPHIGEVCTASVACGVMGYGGNKGAAAVSFSLFRRRVVLVSSHFAAHQVSQCDTEQ